MSSYYTLETTQCIIYNGRDFISWVGEHERWMNSEQGFVSKKEYSQ
jgi:hypothetical protein